MVTKNILTTQKEVVKNWKGDFQAQACDEGIRYVYKGDMTANSYCEFLRIDFFTVSLLGDVGYDIEYNCIEGNKYVLKCETYIDKFMNGKLSFELEDDEDYLGFYGETRGGIGVARWLPDNWKELITDEQIHDLLVAKNIHTIECLIDDDVPDEMKERIAKDWCKDNLDEVKDLLSDSDKCDIAYDYIDDNVSDCLDRAYDKLSSYDQREFLKDCIDNL